MRSTVETQACLSLPGTITISIGYCEVNTQNTTLQACFNQADSALYAAKHNGRNCIVCKQV